MTARKSIDLGKGLHREVSYEELKNRLQRQRADTATKNNILQKHFPTAFEQEQKLVHEANRAARDAHLRKIQERRWMDYLGKSSLTPSAASHQEVVSRVRRPRENQPSKEHFNRVTDFSSWIFQAMPYHRPSRRSQEAGKLGEREVAKLKRVLRPISDGHADWKLLDKDPLDEKPTPREISLLKIDGHSLFGAPDYVYHNPTKGQIVIVEVKVSNPSSWPADGWPNLRAQLWAYGNIDMYLNLAQDIVLIGEIWSKTYSPQTMRESYVPRIRYRWHMADAVFCAQNKELFDLYKAWVLSFKAASAKDAANDA